MVLAVDIGNSNIVIGCFEHDEILFIERLSTNQQCTSLEYVISVRTILEINGLKSDKIEGCIISSVVPAVTETMKSALERLTNTKVMIVGPGIKTGLKIMLDNPVQLGSDRVADAVAAVNIYSAPLIIIDMGTATTVSVAIEPPKKIVGANTVDCMKSGIIHFSASGIDGVVDRIEEYLGEHCTVVSTGGLADKIIPFCKRKIIIDDKLLLKGLMIIYNKNNK